MSAAAAIGTAIGCGSGGTGTPTPGVAGPAVVPLLSIQTDPGKALISFLSWDTEAGSRLGTNLLRAPAFIRVLVGGAWSTSVVLSSTKTNVAPGQVQFDISVTPNANLIWHIDASATNLQMSLQAHGINLADLQAVELVLPLDPTVTPTTVLPSNWLSNGKFVCPAVISAPDFGQMTMQELNRQVIAGRLEGNRDSLTVDLILELNGASQGTTYSLDFTPFILDLPSGFDSSIPWSEIRRPWLNAFQLSAQWGDQTNPFSAPAGVIANNVISDACSFALPAYADHAFFTPELAPGIQLMPLIRRSVDWWLDQRTTPAGIVIGYWDYQTFLDSNPGILIAAWDYVEVTGDLQWLADRIAQLELIADYTASRDVDADGIVEAVQSGNAATLLLPARSSNWFDAVNFGHKDAFANAQIYRAWRCLADLENKLGRSALQLHYSQLADGLRNAYSQTFFNSANGWLGCWKSEDGALHDYASPIVNGIAIEYGLIDNRVSQQILNNLWAKFQATGFARFDLGVPSTLEPILRDDYLQPGVIGGPQLPDGTDTFQIYENAGITGAQTIHFLAAHYVAGMPANAEKVLQAMLQRQKTTSFQNGVRNAFPGGIDWTTWDGTPCGYEGCLAEVFTYLRTFPLRQDILRNRLYRPLLG